MLFGMSYTCICKHSSFSRGIFGCFLIFCTKYRHCVVIVIMSNKVQLRTVSRICRKKCSSGNKGYQGNKTKNRTKLASDQQIAFFTKKKYRYGFLVRQTSLISAHLVLNSLSHINTTRRVGNYLNAV